MICWWFNVGGFNPFQKKVVSLDHETKVQAESKKSLSYHHLVNVVGLLGSRSRHIFSSNQHLKKSYEPGPLYGRKHSKVY